MKYALLMVGLIAASSAFGQYRVRPVINSDYRETLSFDQDQTIYHHGEIFESPEGFYAVFPSEDGAHIVMGELRRNGEQMIYNGVYECDCLTTDKSVKGFRSQVTAEQINAATQQNHGFTYCSIPQLIPTLQPDTEQRFENLGLTYSYEALAVEADRRTKMDRQEKSTGDGPRVFGLFGVIGAFFLGLMLGAAAAS